MVYLTEWDTTRYATAGAFVPALGRAVFDLLDPQPGERVLDLGCGDGTLTAEIVARGATVVGVDASPAMVAAARAKGIDARLGDAAGLGFEAEFDAVFSNAALHWMLDPDPVIAGVHAALQPGGRFVAEMGGHGCVAAVGVALVAALRRRGIDGAGRIPWYFPTVAEYTARLRAAGFEVETAELIPRPTRLPGTMGEWLETFAVPFFGGMGAEDRASVVAEVEEALRPWLCDGDGVWTADYMRLRFSARRPVALS